MKRYMVAILLSAAAQAHSYSADDRHLLVLPAASSQTVQVHPELKDTTVPSSTYRWYGDHNSKYILVVVEQSLNSSYLTLVYDSVIPELKDKYISTGVLSVVSIPAWVGDLRTSVESCINDAAKWSYNSNLRTGINGLAQRFDSLSIDPATVSWAIPTSDAASPTLHKCVSNARMSLAAARYPSGVRGVLNPVLVELRERRPDLFPRYFMHSTLSLGELDKVDKSSASNRPGSHYELRLTKLGGLPEFGFRNPEEAKERSNLILKAITELMESLNQ